MYRLPVNPETTLRDQLISMINVMHLYTGEVVFVPSRVGHSVYVDAAIRAAASAFWWMHMPNRSRLQAAYADYVEAIKLLRDNIDLSDDTVMATNLLGHFEGMMRSHLSACIVHSHASISAVLARPPHEPLSDYAAAVVYTSHDHAFRRPVAAGEASPFDHPRFLALEPPTLGPGFGKDIRALTRSSFQLFIRLPRLIASVRAIRTEQPNASVTKTLELAEELLRSETTKAENVVLHQVKVVPTVESSGRLIVPYSFEFKALEEHRAAVPYWESRLLLYGLYLKLMSLPHVQDINRTRTTAVDTTSLKKGQLRMMTNLLMSMQYAVSRGLFSRQRMAQVGKMCAVWSALQQVDSYRGMSADSVRDWMLRRGSMLYRGWAQLSPKMTANDMDALCDVFCGGRLEGLGSLAVPLKYSKSANARPDPW